MNILPLENDLDARYCYNQSHTMDIVWFSRARSLHFHQRRVRSAILKRLFANI
jgi:hypothetical protein